MSRVETITVAAHGFGAIVAPACGGLTVSAHHNGRPLLYTPDPHPLAPGTIHFFGNWPLVPFANRAFGAVLRFGEETFPLPANDTQSPGNAIHGFSWGEPWEVVTRRPERLVMRHRPKADAGPYRYVAEQSVAATSGGLATTLTVTNEASRTLPFGLGLHPWFPRHADTEVAYAAEACLLIDDRYLPLAAQPPGPESDFSKPRRLDPGRETAIPFLRGAVRAAIAYPSQRYRIVMTMENGAFPMFWSPKGAPFLCLEPQTHAHGAPSETVSQMESPLTPLKPGDSLSLHMSLRTEDL